MSHTIYVRASSASKHLALLAAALAATGCVSGGSSTASDTAASASTSTSTLQSASSTTSTTTASQTSASSTPSTSSSSGSTNQSGGRSPGGATLVFSYPNGFSGAANAFGTGASAQVSGSVIALTSPNFPQHQAGAAWYKTPQDIRSFTTDFTFQVDPSAYGMTFSVQNSNSTTNPLAFGDVASADANVLGYGALNLPNQWPIRNSIAIKFDLTGANGTAYLGATPSGTGLYINGGPYGENGLIPENDLTPLGINLHSGDVMDAHIVYDGNVLTLTLRDTKTNAQARMSWPIDIPAVTGSDYAWVGFTAGTIPNVSQNILTWSYWQGYNTELSPPTFSVPAGQYSSSQSVTISGPSGAAIYYTTNGKAPTTSSAQYTGPITVTANTVVQAVAVESGYSDSSVASAYYQIVPNGTPVIDFPNGFSGASNLITTAGAATISGSSLVLTDTSQVNESGAAWFSIPVNVQNFTAKFTLAAQATDGSGLTFTIQNQNPASTDPSALVVSGGPTTVGLNGTGLGYQGILNSVAVAFDIFKPTGSNGDYIGLYTNGAAPGRSNIDISSSGVSLPSGDPLAVTIAYNGSVLSLTVTDTKTQASFTHSWTLDIPTIVGGNTAYVGFTGSTGWFSALQNVSSWTFSN